MIAMHRKPHYAWAICLGCTVSMFAILGVCVNTFSVVLPYIRTQNGFSHTQVSLLPTVRMIFYLLSVAVSTQVCRRISYRLCVTGSAVLSTLAMVLYAHARTIAVCYADATRAKELLHWEAKRDLNAMCRDAWNWQKQNPRGYGDKE